MPFGRLRRFFNPATPHWSLGVLILIGGLSTGITTMVTVLVWAVTSATAFHRFLGDRGFAIFLGGAALSVFFGTFFALGVGSQRLPATSARPPKSVVHDGGQKVAPQPAPLLVERA